VKTFVLARSVVREILDPYVSRARYAILSKAAISPFSRRKNRCSVGGFFAVFRAKRITLLENATHLNTRNSDRRTDWFFCDMTKINLVFFFAFLTFWINCVNTFVLPFFVYEFPLEGVYPFVHPPGGSLFSSLNASQPPWPGTRRRPGAGSAAT